MNAPQPRSTAVVHGLGLAALDAGLVVVSDELTRRDLQEGATAGADALVLHSRRRSALRPWIAPAPASSSFHEIWQGTLGAAVLTVRERQVLGMVVLGCTNAEIARRLYVAETTVKSHLSTAFAKLGVRSRNEAVGAILDPDRGLGTGILAISEGEVPSR